MFGDNSFGLSGAQSTFQYFSCSSTATETSLSQCSFSGSCYIGTCTTEYGIRCFGPFVQLAPPQDDNILIFIQHVCACMCMYVCVQCLRDVQQDLFALLVETLTRREYRRCVSMESGAASVILAGLPLMDMCSARNSDLMI